MQKKDELPDSSDALPHHHVKVRLKPSTLAGIGVFAVEPIEKGEAVFPGDDGEVRWISRASLIRADLSETEKELYRDFAIFKTDRCGCPVSFGRITIAWYLNRPNDTQEPNVECDIADGYKFYAARAIRVGEELTVRYGDFSLDAWL